MHPTVYTVFRAMMPLLKPSGRALEIGSIPSDMALLAMPELAHMERIGINLQPPSRWNDFEIIQGNANKMEMFKNGEFDLVLSNAMLEHDKKFWLTCAEIRRILRPGGIAVLGAPGYAPEGDLMALGVPRPGGLAGSEWDMCTLTFKYHAHPDDYYRFTERAMRDVLLEGFEDVFTQAIMMPPRIIGTGRRSA